MNGMELAMDKYCSIEAATPGFPRDLTWNDFPTNEDPGVPWDAFTSSGYAVTQWAFTAGSAPGDRRGGYFVDPFKVTVSFLADRSWAKSSAKSSKRLLAHEQGHFDITGLLARDLVRRVRALRVYGPELRHTDGSMRAGNRLLEQKMKRVLDRVASLNTAIQNGGVEGESIYDTDTEHGTDEKGQREWTAMLHQIKVRNLSLEDTLVARGFVTVASDPPDGPAIFK
jgi:hypothetical protein